MAAPSHLRYDSLLRPNLRLVARGMGAGLMGLLALLSCASAQTLPIPAHEGVIHIWGHGHKGKDYIATLLHAWQDGFQKTHPDARFEDELFGNASALGGLYTGTAELAIMDREASFTEIDAYQQGTGHDPFRIPIARGSIATPHHAPALIISVDSANPLAQLTLKQLDGIFDADHRLSPQSYKTWGDLGLTGKWAAKPIQIYTYNIQSAEVQFFERAALKGSQKFSCCMTLFETTSGSPARARIAAALAKDRDGLALSTLPVPGLKVIALAATNDAHAVLPTTETISSGQYPLARTVYVYVNRKPKSPIVPNLAAFLDYILSPEGQGIAARVGGYLPLSPQAAAQARESLR